jgi:hypothetical protein
VIGVYLTGVRDAVSLLVVGAFAMIMVACILLIRVSVTLSGTLYQLADRFHVARSEIKQLLEKQTADDAENAFDYFTRVMMPERDVLKEQLADAKERMMQISSIQQELGQLRQELG